MAGIGFQLRRMAQEETFTGDAKAYAYSSIVSSGPWIVSILCLASLWTFSSPYLGVEYQKLFRVMVVYTYAFSLITTGVLQLLVTRFLADRLYLKQKNIFLPTYVGLILLTSVAQFISAVLFYLYSDVSIYFKIAGVVLYVAVSCIWQTMIFLSTVRDFLGVVLAFVIGGVISFLLALILGRSFGFDGHVLGFTIGQVSILFLLAKKVFEEFDSAVLCDFNFLREARKYSELVWIGLFYYLAIWCDKFIMWFSPQGEHVKALFYSHYPYDSCVFMAFLTIIPSLAHFLIDVETNFYECYKGFYGAILNKGTFSEIESKKKDLIKVLLETGSRMLVLQAVVTCLYLFYAPTLAVFLELDVSVVPVLWAAGLGAFFHAFLLVAIILIMYFDQRRPVVWITLFYFVTNTVLMYFNAHFWPDKLGASYALSTALTLLLALYYLKWTLSNLEYITFVRQPYEKQSLPLEPAVTRK
jgi:uncharacterized membrane protein